MLKNWSRTERWAAVLVAVVLTFAFCCMVAFVFRVAQTRRPTSDVVVQPTPVPPTAEPEIVPVEPTPTATLVVPPTNTPTPELIPTDTPAAQPSPIPALSADCLAYMEAHEIHRVKWYDLLNQWEEATDMKEVRALTAGMALLAAEAKAMNVPACAVESHEVWLKHQITLGAAG